MDSLLFSEWELFSRRDRLAMLDLLRVTEGADTDAER